ncbi:hypothetical protein DMJ13_18380 [halophilic archaeon]|nr:hypothetical protein DMJ13_18380 [halophilic archaeon]
MNENAAIIAQIVEQNTGGKTRKTIRREQVRTIAQHSRFNGDLGTAITKAIEEGYIEEEDGELVATERVDELLRGRCYSMG